MTHPTKQLRNKIGSFLIEPDSADGGDTLAIALCTYFDGHLGRPKDDPETENGWGEWVELKVNAALDGLTTEVMGSDHGDKGSRGSSDTQGSLAANHGTTAPSVAKAVEPDRSRLLTSKNRNLPETHYRAFSYDQLVRQCMTLEGALHDRGDEIERLTGDIETGFMAGSYARLKNLQEAERERDRLSHDVEQLTKAASAEATLAERLRAALFQHACHCGPTDPNPAVHADWCPYRQALSGDSSAGETSPEPPPTAQWLAVQFHETYERLAPKFGYETRRGTRHFDPESPNGRLMMAVCAELLQREPTLRPSAVETSPRHLTESERASFERAFRKSSRVVHEGELAQAEKASAQPSPEMMCITYERLGRCLWHEDCDKSSIRSGVMVEVRVEDTRTLLRCMSCGREGYFPVGSTSARVLVEGPAVNGLANGTISNRGESK